MTKDEYIRWKNDRDTNAANWKYEDCSGADNLIRDTALESLSKWLSGLHPALREYVTICARAHFGSVETDEFLTQINAYPDWM